MSEQTREAWLESAVQHLAPIFADADRSIPDVRVSCGFPSKHATSTRNRFIGECWATHQATDGRRQIYISPVLADVGEVLAVLVHELCHAVLDNIGGHRGPFVSLMKAVGLTGKPTATVAGSRLVERLNEVSSDLGPYPHAALVPRVKTRPGSRLRLYECSCPIKVRVASDSFDATCNGCAQAFEMRS